MIKSHNCLNLQWLILALAALSSLLMLANAVWASYRVQRQQLIDNTLESNRVYAQKLAQSTHYFILGSQQQLGYSAAELGTVEGVSGHHADEARRIKSQSDAFNSVIIVNGYGKVMATSPILPALNGKILTSRASQSALTIRSPAISSPYIADTGKLVVTISHPIFDSQGIYAGYVSAAIHLKEQNILHSLLGKHYYRDGSYLYVVGRDGKLLYHPEPSRVGESALRNAVVQAVSQGKAGSLHTVNSHGVHMLAGFAPIPSVGWGVVAQRPVESTLRSLDDLMLNMLGYSAPLGLLSLLLIWRLSRKIASPLRKLAQSTRTRDVSRAIVEVTAVNSWYYEAAQLSRAILMSFKSLRERIGALDKASMTDPLTGLLNRRGLERGLGQLHASGRPIGIVAIDVDHFKKVNDSFGHAAGDQVIAGLAELMKVNARAEDILCRFGGEEFLLLLPDADSKRAVDVAERLRESIQRNVFSDVGHITISAGVAHFPETEADLDLAIRQADKALYQSKEKGRNQVVLYQKRSSPSTR